MLKLNENLKCKGFNTDIIKQKININCERCIKRRNLSCWK